MKYTLDARNKKIGRVASQAAQILMGKNLTSFAKNVVAESTVEILNTKDADVTAKKKVGDKYVTYTGHRGGLLSETLGELITRQGFSEAFRRAVYRMLPPNKLRAKRMKNLIIKE
ncbi:MAG: uL13 family ribosomal protein [Candidatus Paceibacterota bacterium]|jgi:large subunit ribosomal protein L13